MVHIFTKYTLNILYLYEMFILIDFFYIFAYAQSLQSANDGKVMTNEIMTTVQRYIIFV